MNKNFLLAISFIIAVNTCTATEKNDDPFYLLAIRNTNDFVNWIMTPGNDAHVKNATGKTLLHAAARYDNVAAAELLLKKGIPVDSRDTLDNKTPLIEATLIPTLEEGNTIGHISVALLLLQHGAQINAQDRQGNTALHYAAIFGTAPMIALLLARFANQTITNNNGLTALDLIKHQSHNMCIALLTPPAI